MLVLKKNSFSVIIFFTFSSHSFESQVNLVNQKRTSIYHSHGKIINQYQNWMNICHAYSYYDPKNVY